MAGLKERSHRTFICSVLFIDIVSYSEQSVEEQTRLKTRLNTVLRDAVRDVAPQDRIMLDTGDGVAMGFLGDPEGALFAALHLREILQTVPPPEGKPLNVRMGINLGPVKLLKDINNQPNLIGDGINVAQRIMAFAQPGQLLVSRSYYEIVSRLSQDYEKLFQYMGSRADKHVREHDIYAVALAGASPRRGRLPVPPGSPVSADAEQGNLVSPPAETAADPMTAPAAAGTAEDPRILSALGQKRWFWLAGGAVLMGVAVLLTLWVAGKPDHALAPKPAGGIAPGGPSSAPPRPAETPERAGQATAVPSSPAEPFKPMTAPKAGEIAFTLTEVRQAGRTVTFILRMRNLSEEDRTIALYDEAYRWTRSRLTTEAGKAFEVSRVTFYRDSRKLTMADAGSRGASFPAGGAGAVHLTFKRIPADTKRIKALYVHPFIYSSWSRWREQDVIFRDIPVRQGDSRPSGRGERDSGEGDES